MKISVKNAYLIIGIGLGLAVGFVSGIMHAEQIHRDEVIKQYDYTIPAKNIVVDEIQNHADGTCEYQFRFGYGMFNVQGYFDDEVGKFEIGDTVRINFKD